MLGLTVCPSVRLSVCPFANSSQDIHYTNFENSLSYRKFHRDFPETLKIRLLVTFLELRSFMLAEATNFKKFHAKMSQKNIVFKNSSESEYQVRLNFRSPCVGLLAKLGQSKPKNEPKIHFL